MKRMMVIAALGLLFAACIPYVQPGASTVPPRPIDVQPASPLPGTYTYQCDDGRLMVEYLPDNTVRVFYEGRYIEMEKIPSASGDIYSNGDFRWYSHRGDQGYLTQRGQVEMSGCRR